MEKKGSKKLSVKWSVIDPTPNDLAVRMASQESMGTPSTPSNISHEESILELYFQFLSQTNHDKAKDLVDSEKDGHKFSHVASWGETLQCLSQLATAEKNYNNLVFLSGKRFTNIVRTKDSAKSIYSLLLQEFQRMENMLSPVPLGEATVTFCTPGVEQLLAHISGQLCSFIRARNKMIEFYEQLSSLSTVRLWVSFEDLVMMCEEILNEHLKRFHHPLLAPIKAVFSLECESLCHLLRAQVLMSTWCYLPSVLQLHQGYSKLKTWSGMIPVKEVKSTFGRSSSKSNPYPPLLNWLLKFKGILLSKFGLYFYDILCKQTMPAEIKNVMSKTTEDFVSKLQNFQRKHDAYNVYLVLDTQGLGRVAGQAGYQHPDKYLETPQGLETYPPIFSYPAERVVNTAHWPNIVMMINSSPDAPGEKVQFFYDRATEKRSHSSYFITRVEPRISLVVVFESKKNEKDSNISAFMTDIAAQLRCHTIIASLKASARS